jgi:hypothetical protein
MAYNSKLLKHLKTDQPASEPASGTTTKASYTEKSPDDLHLALETFYAEGGAEILGKNPLAAKVAGRSLTTYLSENSTLPDRKRPTPGAISIELQVRKPEELHQILGDALDGRYESKYAQFIAQYGQVVSATHEKASKAYLEK